MTAILATVLFLFADGTPAKHAWVTCTGVPVYESGTDDKRSMPEGTPLIVDSRGAVIIIAAKPKTIHCEAWIGARSFSGPIALTNKAVEVAVLR